MGVFKGWFTIEEFESTNHNLYECLVCGKKMKKNDVYIDKTMPQAYGVSKVYGISYECLYKLPCICKECNDTIIKDYSIEYEYEECKRCEGGYIKEYSHIKNGKCFTCNGSGKINTCRFIPIDELELINREECASAIMSDLGFDSCDELNEYFDFCDSFDGEW